MPLVPGCPRCAMPVTVQPDGSRFSCPSHGIVDEVWHPREEATYTGFIDHLQRAAGSPSTPFPTYLPWPLSPGWRITDFASVAGQERVCATMTCVSGTSQLDGPVDVLVITEEAGTGFGARVAGTTHDDPGADLGGEPSSLRVRIGSQQIPLWPVSTSGEAGEWDRSVVAGEADGRWLWVVLRPASAMLLLRDDWILRDVSGLGPPLIEMPFGGPRPPW